MNNIKKQGEEELKRALLMMKYDNRKTLTENVEVISEEIPAYPAPKDEPVVKSSVTMGTAQEYAENNSKSINTLLGLKEIPKGFSEDDASEVQQEVMKDNGLVDALDQNPLGFGLGEEDLQFVSQTIKGSKGRCFKNKLDGLYYPKIEGLRYFYSVDEDDESLYGEIKDPRGFDYAETGLWSQSTTAEMVQRYQEWLDVMDDTQANVEDEGKPTGNQQPTPEPTPPPKPKNNPYKDIEWEDDDSDDSKIEG